MNKEMHIVSKPTKLDLKCMLDVNCIIYQPKINIQF